MGRTLVTGGAGLVGSHVARALVERGDEVRVTVRPTSPRDALEGVDAEIVDVDVTDRGQVRRAMRGIERVFHVAGTTNLRDVGRDVHHVSVEGTRTVLEEALRAGVRRAVQTSSVAAIGPAPRGSTADEEQLVAPGHHGLPLVSARHEAERAALRVAAMGLPLVTVCPSLVLGPGDVGRTSTEIVRRFLRREIPVYVDGALNIVGAADVARGHLLADERGALGHRYILGGRNFTLDRLFADLGRLSGVAPPALKLPLPAALALARALQVAPGTPALTVTEVRSLSLWWAYRSTKAERELGWQTGHAEQPLVDTIAWYREREPEALAAAGASQPLALRVTGHAVDRLTGAVRFVVRS